MENEKTEEEEGESELALKRGGGNDGGVWTNEWDVMRTKGTMSMKKKDRACIYGKGLFDRVCA